MKFSGKNVLITGCNRGIGREIMVAFMKEGANIIACTRSCNEELHKYYTECCKKYNIEITSLFFDLNDEDSIKNAFKSINDKKLKLDVAINNAGMPHMGLLLFTPIKTIKDVFQINFFATVLICQLTSKIMMRQKSGVIINMGSMAGCENFSGYTAYGASKAAVIQFTRTLAREMAPFNVRVNSISPGLLEEGMGALQHDKSSDEIIERTDLKRRGSAKDIANMALFLASDEANFITGQNIRVDGGM